MTATTFKDNIGKEDIRQFGGNNRTFQRRNSAGALLTLHSVGNVVDVLSAFGDGTTPAHVDLTDAIVGAKGNEVTFELAPGTWPVTANLTIPSTVTVHLLRGAAFSVSTGVTLTINGPVFADDTTWYSGAGTVTVASGVSQVTGAAIKAGTTLECVTSLVVGTTAAIGTNATVGGTLGVTGASTLTGNTTVGGTLGVTGATTVANLSVSGTLGGKLAFRGALAYIGASVPTINTSELTKVDFATEDYDTSAIHDNSTNPSRMTVPAGVTRIRLLCSIAFAVNGSGERQVEFLKNNSSSYNGYTYLLGSYFPTVLVSSPVLTVIAGDYFEVQVWQSSGSPLNLGAASWFAMEVIE